MGQDVSQLGAAFEAAKTAIHFNPESVDIATAGELPVADVIWIMSIIDSSPSEEVELVNVHAEDDTACVHLRLMAITDENGMIVGGSAKDDREVSKDSQAMDLLKQCLFAPIVWKPHRPRYLGFRDDKFFASGLPLEEIGIQKISMLTGTAGPDILPKELEHRRSCIHCRKRGSITLFDMCSGCEAVYYCSEQCKSQDLDHKRDIHGHRYWCSKMKQYLTRTKELADLPFTFIKETTDPKFHDLKLKEFLSRHGVLNQGYWRWEYFEDEMPAFGALVPDVFPVCLPLEGDTLENNPTAELPPVNSWEDYYRWRGFGLDSPIAVLLQWPLTMYRILQHHVPQDYPDLKLTLESTDTFTVHVVGVEKEADFAPLFTELGHLFKDATFDIVLVGSEISTKVHKKVIQVHPKVKVTLIKGLYHKVTLESPHLIIGFNAGLAAYSSWVETLTELQKNATPAYFTDFCQYSCEYSKAPMEGLDLGTVSPPALNPFRSPIRKFCEEHDMPWYSNAFIYRLLYDK